MEDGGLGCFVGWRWRRFIAWQSRGGERGLGVLGNCCSSCVARKKTCVGLYAYHEGYEDDKNGHDSIVNVSNANTFLVPHNERDVICEPSGAKERTLLQFKTYARSGLRMRVVRVRRSESILRFVGQSLHTMVPNITT